MVDAGIFDTSVLIVDRGIAPTSGDIVIALTDGEHQARRLTSEHGVAVLRGEGLGGEVHVVAAELDIWGVVTWILTPLARRHEQLDGALAGVDLGQLLIRDRASSYLWRAAGGSMTGSGICDGSLLIVDRGIRPDDGSILIAIVDNEHTVKRLDLTGPTPLLRADNPNHPDIMLSELSELTVWGTVTWSITKARVGRHG